MLMSIIIGGTGLAVAEIYMKEYDPLVDDIDPYELYELFITGAIPGCVIMNVLGLILGIMGKIEVNKERAIDRPEKFENFISIAGIISNLIGIALIAIVGPFVVVNTVSKGW